MNARESSEEGDEIVKRILFVVKAEARQAKITPSKAKKKAAKSSFPRRPLKCSINSFSSRLFAANLLLRVRCTPNTESTSPSPSLNEMRNKQIEKNVNTFSRRYMNLITDQWSLWNGSLFLPSATGTGKSLANILLFYIFLRIMLLFVERYEYHINDNSFMPWKTYNEQSYFTAIVYGLSSV